MNIHLICSKCNKLGHSIGQHHYPSMSRVQCEGCNFSWFVCHICGDVDNSHRKCIFETSGQILKHHRRIHVDGFGLESENTCQLVSEHSEFVLESNIDELESNLDSCNDFININERDDNYMYLNDTNPSMKKYFAYIGREQASDYLVSMAQFHSDAYVGKMSKEEVDVHVNFASILMKTSRLEIPQLLSTIEKIVNVRVKQTLQEKQLMNNSDLVSPTRTQIPLTESSVRSLYLKGKYSLIENLPRPKVSMLEDGKHAYVSLYDIIQDAFGHGLDILNLNETKKMKSASSDIMNIHESKRAELIKNSSPKDAFVFLLFEWRDDAKGNRGMRNNGSMWVRTVTFLSGSSNNTRFHTYPVSIGPKDADHDIVEDRFKEELKTLKNHAIKHYVYSSVLGKDIRVYGDVFASLMDQPERRSSNSLMLGNALFASRWGYSMNLKKLQNVLPPCELCYNKMKRKACASTIVIHDLFSDPICDQCLNWDVDRSHKLLHYKSPDSFPKGELSENALGELVPFKLSYDILTHNISKVFANVTSGKWTVTQARALLNVLCISHTAQDNIIAHAQNAFHLQYLEGNQFEYQRRYIDILRLRKKYPLLFLQWQHPPLWTRDIPMNRTNDAIMHLMFLGIEKSVNKDITKFLVYNEKQSLFARLVSNLLTDALSLSIRDWCDILPYNDGHFSNWISDNYLSMSRLSPWFYTCLQKVMRNYVEPSRPVKDWTKSDCKKWLKLRDLNFDCNSVKEFRRVILQYKSMLTVPPIKPRHDLEKQCNLVLAMINAKTCMIYRLMSHKMNREIISEIDFYIKLFLTLYVKFDMLYNTSKKNPSWVTASNFICLLNLPDLIQEVGPIRNLWEGGDMGEKILGSVKDEFHGFRTNWTKALLDRVYSNITMDKVIKALHSKVGIKEENKYHHRYGRFHKYNSYLEVKIQIHKNKIISIVQEGKHEFFIFLKDFRKFRINVNYEEPCEKLCGLHYFSWTLQETAIDCSNMRNIRSEQKYVRTCLLLPWQLHDTESKWNMYAIISDDWKTMISDYKFVLPYMTSCP